MRVAYQGEAGAFSEEISLAALPGAQTTGFETFDAVAEALEAGSVDVACLPVENSLFGQIGRTYELVDHYDLRVVEAGVLHIRQCLIAPAPIAPEAIRTVASHPVALEQCRALFRAYPGFKRLPVHDTAGAVRAMIDRSLEADACIAGEFAAHRYGGIVVLRDVHDDEANFTRFFFLVRSGAGDPFSESGETSDATISAELANRPGSLRDALSLFADARINLTNIVCRPIPSRPWSYRFFFEVEAPAHVARDAAKALSVVGTARLCGCYRTYGRR